MALKLYAYSESSKTNDATGTIDGNSVTIKSAAVKTTPPSFFVIPTYVFSDKTNGLCNAVDLAMRYTGDSIDDIDSVVFRSPTTLAPVTSDNLDDYSDISFTKVLNGIYTRDGTATSVILTSIQTGDGTTYAKAIDRTKDGVQVSYTPDGANGVALALMLAPPNLEENISYDSIVLGIRGINRNALVAEGNAGIGLYGHHFFGKAKKLLYKQNMAYGADVLDNIPSEFINEPTGDNSNYYIKRDAVYYTLSLAERANNSLYDNWTFPASHLTASITSGVSNSTFTIDATAEVISQFNYLVLLLWANGTNGGLGSSTRWFRIVELCYMFIKSLSIKSEIYAPMQGRIFSGSYWATNRAYPHATGDLIADPVDMLEHICRLQLPDTGTAQVSGQYNPNALINTSTDRGGFDCADLVPIRASRPGFQILDEGEAWTDKIKKELCSSFFIGSYIDRLGRECVANIVPNTATAIYAVTLRDIVGDIGEVEEPAVDGIFCEPWVSYNFNYGSGKYDSELSILNVAQSVWKPEYTPGFDCATLVHSNNTKSDGQHYWEECKAMYAKYHAIEKPSSNWTDKKYIRTYSNAILYLYRWLRLMELRRLPFSVPYATGKTWELLDIVSLCLPHQTNNITVLAEIESLKISRSTGKCAVSVVLLDYLS